MECVDESTILLCLLAELISKDVESTDFSFSRLRDAYAGSLNPVAGILLKFDLFSDLLAD